MAGEVRTYQFKDLNAVLSGDEEPKETPASVERRKNPQPTLRRRWRQQEEPKCTT